MGSPVIPTQTLNGNQALHLSHTRALCFDIALIKVSSVEPHYLPIAGTLKGATLPPLVRVGLGTIAITRWFQNSRIEALLPNVVYRHAQSALIFWHERLEVPKQGRIKKD